MSEHDSSPTGERRDEVRDAQTPPPGYVLAFRVIGTPVPQSGQRQVTTASGLRLPTTGGKGLLSWRRSIAIESDVRRLDVGTLDGALGLDVVFRFAMAQTRAKRARLRAFNILPHAARPDLDKLVRAVFDGMREGGLIRDDAQIASLCAFKCEVRDDWIGADIKLRRLEETWRRMI